MAFTLVTLTAASLGEATAVIGVCVQALVVGILEETDTALQSPRAADHVYGDLQFPKWALKIAKGKL